MRTSIRLRWLLPAVLTVFWLGVGSLAGPFVGQLSEVTENDETAFLPESAESTQVSAIQQEFVTEASLPVVVVWEEPDGLPSDAVPTARRQLSAVTDLDSIGDRASPPITSDDNEAISAVVNIDSAYAGEVGEVVPDIRAAVEPLEGGSAHVTGPGGFAADLGEAFAGIDGLLLGVALLVVLLILLAVYRSPVLPIVVLVSAVFGLGVAAFAVYQLADAGTLALNGQSQGIMFILVVGAATDYALLLVARFREELRDQPDRFAAMRVALRQVVGPIVASGGTVILGVLCLLLSDLKSNQSLGPVAAIGIAGAMIVSLTFLPAVLTLLGRAAYWPARPRVGSAHPEERGVWRRVADLVARRPRASWVGVSAVLLAMAALLPMFRASGISQSELFLADVDSVAGQQVLAEHFPGGAGSPAVVVAGQQNVDRVLQTVKGTDGVSRAQPVTAGPPSRPRGEPKVVDGQVLVEVTLADPATSEQAIETVRDLRDNLDEVSDNILVGGTTAQTLDTNEISARDRTVIIPVVLAVILIVLILLLRALVAPLLLILTVVLSYAATLGISGVVFQHLFGWPGADPAVPLFAFVFLVALGVDYNIFLMTRVREESTNSGTRQGIWLGLVRTGGVITSAGVVLAATFATLGVIPILFLAQIAFLVAFGVLLDALVVRSILVPSLGLELGDRLWWPGRLARAPARHRDEDQAVRRGGGADS